MRRIIVFFAVILLFLHFSSSQVFAQGFDVSVSAASAVLIEAQTGKVLYAKNENEKRPMASTTKIMTALICLESGNLDEQFVVDSSAIKVEGSSMGLVEGDIVTKRSLCIGMLLPSGNDAANAAAIKIAGSFEKFAEMMNERAVKIGMLNTHFVTPSGLDADGHYSTAYDMALLAREALKNPDFKAICSQKNIKLSYGNPPYDRWLKNTNKLLTYYNGCIGVKTGFTDAAGRCLVSATERNGVCLI
ncbi:MAG: D-alanyl-D-alanine carboxypeptidase, partial [Oscillospiraceae bacterium]|nr:D-alanyl-D-alanine carboxypeptidase [Oscillospiraceae bacterium]